MNNHLRYCPKHRKPLPCSHCSLAAKPAQGPAAVAVMEPKPTPAPSKPVKMIKVPVEQKYCMKHAKEHPCPRCFEDEVSWRRITNSNPLADFINKSIQDGLKDKLAEIVKQRNLNPEWFVGLRLDEELLAQIAKRQPVQLDLAAIPGYDVNKYRHEINTALRYIRQSIQGYFKTSGDSDRGLDDLRQIVDLEIFLSSRRYGDEMNGALAYKIAWNQGRRFFKELAEQPPTVSFDDHGTDEDGKPREMSQVEENISVIQYADQSEDGPSVPTSSWTFTDVDLGRRTGKGAGPVVTPPRPGLAEQIQEKLPALIALVQTWHGTKRRIADILLKNPDATVREFPGVPKTTAARVRATVLAEFRKIIES